MAVKIQYPGVREAIDSDLANMQWLIAMLDALMPSVDMRSLVRDLTERIVEECDYRQELRNQADFAAAWAHEPGVVVPAVYPELSSPRVLVSGFIPACEWPQMMEQAWAEQKSHYGRVIFRFVFESLFRHGMFNRDPHPGNYLFLEDGRVAFIDYGSVQRFDAPKRADFARLRQALPQGGEERGFLQASRAVFPRPADLDPELGECVDRMLERCFEPVRAAQPFRFDAAYTARVMEAMMRMKLVMNKKLLRGRRAYPLDLEQADAGLAFLGRIAFGLASVLSKLECEGDFRAILADIPLDGPDPDQLSS